MMTELPEMWDGNLGTMPVGKLSIKLTDPDGTTIHWELYRAVPQLRAVKRAEVDRMLKLDVTETAQIEWAAQIVFALKKEGTLSFLSIATVFM